MKLKLEKIFNHYGYKNQRLKLVEECAELITAIMKDDDKNFVEEMADVGILLNQILGHFPEIKERFEFWFDFKVNRQIERIENETRRS